MGRGDNMAVRNESGDLIFPSRQDSPVSVALRGNTGEVAALWCCLQELRDQFGKVAGVVESLAALRVMDEEAALIEMALMAQGQERLVENVWQTIGECEARAKALSPEFSSITKSGSSAAAKAGSSTSAPGEYVAELVQPPRAATPSSTHAEGPELHGADTDEHTDEHDTPDEHEAVDSPVSVDRSGTRPVHSRTEPVEVAEPGSITQVDATDVVRVLIVDDEPAVLRAFGRVLSQRYEVLTARNGAEALKVVLAEKQIDAIVCDLNMPRLNGGSFFAELRELKPQLLNRVVFCTGTTLSHRGERFLKGLQAPVLHKPVAAEALLSVVDSVCGERGRADKMRAF